MKGCGLLKKLLSTEGFVHSDACFRSVLAVKSQRSRSRIRKVNKESRSSTGVASCVLLIVYMALVQLCYFLVVTR
jgi:hypothetical protein